MKKVVLIGDSIRIGYQETVQKELAGVAEVWGPAENGGNSVNVLSNLNGWVLKRQPDLVHVNCGLHDLKTLAREERELVVPLPFYRRNVEALFRLIRQHTAAKIVWASTTPVLTDRIRKARITPGDFLRYDSDVREFNAAATAEAKNAGVPVNDLYSVITGAGVETCLTGDGVHFTSEAYTRLGEAVAGAIRKQLNLL